MKVSDNKQKVLVQVKELKKWFPIKKGIIQKTVGYVKAVDNVSFDVYKGETLGLVGESGCGKSTLSRTVLRLIEPTSGEIYYDGKDFINISKRDLRAIRRQMQIVFQDPFGSLHPKMQIGKIIEEPLIIGKWGNKQERQARIRELIKLVDLKEEHLERYPHEFSGGQRQRIVIARALATNPKLIICDEPVSALDVSVRSQVLNLLVELQEKFGLTYMFISHDLSVVEHICSRIAVMYLGKIIEIGTKEEIFNNTLHPYTQALLSSIPLINSDRKVEKITLEGDIPSPANPPEGCYFHTRCRYKKEICLKTPEFTQACKGHFVACHRYREIKKEQRGG
ncbi:MAG: dipeptide ABC transporter ATP-binding protein [Desulfitobacteriaceae bacterium]|jgi:oligopeptide/dipeptide ABC transporter ATP-binding protein|nr:dipeptide ABC transporter ATP-binding protein [Desulfitobacteriaceae bacterium]MDD4401892.1 dipeptide ABC transporter ATP-binding protein [Desulfitobacteriaceae bacterium]